MTPTPRPVVIFIHGLNTFGDDLIHMGPLNFGPMVQGWRPRLEEIGCEVHSLKEMGFGLIEDQVERAMKQIERFLLPCLHALHQQLLALHFDELDTAVLGAPLLGGVVGQRTRCTGASSARFVRRSAS